MEKHRLAIGTRGSPLALWQARHVREALIAAQVADQAEIDLNTITTSGDRIQDRALRDFGGKGLFTKEIDDALLADRIDLAVHSIKDLPTELPAGLVLGAVLPRGDVRDAFIGSNAKSLAELPSGAVVGTSSLRRQAQIRRRRPDLRVIDFRGNVETRLRKLDQGMADATLLALAGLERLGLEGHASSVLSPKEMLPAVGQGAIGVVCRTDDGKLRAKLELLNDASSSHAVACERAFLGRLDGSCKTPIAGLAEIGERGLQFRGMILKPDGSDALETILVGDPADAEMIGAQAGQELIDRAGPEFLASIR